MMGWLGGWQYRKSHVVNSASGAGTGYQVRIKAHYGSGTDSGEDVYLNSHCRTDFGDVRFTDDDGVTLLDYWMEEKVDSDYAVFWVEVADDLSSSNATIYIYYGKSDATTTSNGDNTFIFFDDFEDGSIDNDKWTVSSGTWVEENGVLKQTNTSETEDHHIYSTINVGYDIALHAKCYRNIGTTWHFGTLIRASGDQQNFYLGVYEIGTNTLSLGRKKNGDWSGWLDTQSFTVNLDTWYKSIFKAYDTDIEFEDEESGTTVSYASAEDLAQKIGLHCRGGETWFDNIFVRKYVDPEPSHGSWGSEETAGGQTYEINVDAVVQSHATITKETIFNVEKDAAVSGHSLTAQEVGFNVVRDALVQASVVMQVLGVYPFNVEALVGASADAQFRQTLGISRDAAVAVVSVPLFQSMFNVGSDAVVGVVAEVGVVKEGEVKVTRVFLVLGDLAIQLTGD